MFVKHQLTTNVKLLQKAAIIRQHHSNLEVLLLQRSSDALSRPNCWDLPGGNSEWPQNKSSMANLHLADLSREIVEETALQINTNALQLKNLVHFSTYFDSNKQVFSIIGGWFVNFDSTNQVEIQISLEHQKYAWVSQTDLHEYDFGGQQGAFVLEIILNSFNEIHRRL